MNQTPPHCPACGSSATLPFESEENSAGNESLAEIILTIFFIFLFLFLIFLLFLLSHASLPISVILVLAVFLFLRRKKKKHLQTKNQANAFVCLDCSHNFKA
jgi:ABC-type bacteriocin/lantibiotic exporter with double-glycine peptidase domain